MLLNIIDQSRLSMGKQILILLIIALLALVIVWLTGADYIIPDSPRP